MLGVSVLVQKNRKGTFIKKTSFALGIAGEIREAIGTNSPPASSERPAILLVYQAFVFTLIHL